MLAIASFLIAHEKDNANSLEDPKTSIYTRFQGTIVNYKEKY